MNILNYLTEIEKEQQPETIVIQESENDTVKFITSSYDNAVVKWEWDKSSEGAKIRPVNPPQFYIGAKAWP